MEEGTNVCISTVKSTYALLQLPENRNRVSETKVSERYLDTGRYPCVSTKVKLFPVKETVSVISFGRGSLFGATDCSVKQEKKVIKKKDKMNIG